jgi:hypothetical protein
VSLLGLSPREGSDLQLQVLRAGLVWVLKFNKHCSIFVLFDKKFPILD